MISKPVRALLLGACLIMPASYVLAGDDDDKKEDDAPAMQVMVDEDGEIIEAEDDSGAVRVPAGTIQQRGASQLSPQSTTPVTYHADGSVSAQVGREHYKYLVIRIDEDGKEVVDHVPVDELPDFEKAAPVDTKEQ